MEILRTVEVIGSESFAYCMELESGLFEPESTLKVLECAAFARCPFEAIVLPGTTEIIEQDDFAQCGSLKSVSFERDVILKRIESRSFSAVLFLDLKGSALWSSL